MSNEFTCNRSLDKCSCPDPIHIACKCADLAKKISKIEKKFIFDQRTRRVGKIGPLDRKETEKLTKRTVRKERQSNLGQKSSEDLLKSVHIDVKQAASETEERDVNISSTDLDFVPPRSTSLQMRVGFKATALANDRYGVSDRATAAIASSVLKDMGIVSQSDKSFVIDRHKIRREREKCQEHLKEVQLNARAIKGPKAIYFDGRADNTLVPITKGNKRYQSHVIEEHISIIEEPESKYLIHVVPSSKSGKDSAMSIVSNLRENGVDLSDVEVVGADGTATNTGWNNGAIRYIEILFNKPLQHVICLLHFNELPLRHLIEKLDGKTTGPQSYFDPIGKILSGCESLPVIKFHRIEC